jgi:hypothetical protein
LRRLLGGLLLDAIPVSVPRTCAAFDGIGGADGVLDLENGMLMPNSFFFGLLMGSSGFFSAISWDLSASE